MRIKVEVDIFDDPELCFSGSGLRGEIMRFYIRHGYCTLFASGDYDYWNPLSDCTKLELNQFGKYVKCEQCKDIYNQVVK